MTKAICFNCKKNIPTMKTMEDLLISGLPIFCCIKCSLEFPDNHTKEFNSRLEDLRKRCQND